MCADYEQMWSELGLNLEAHDALLQVLGKGYQDIYLNQSGRPGGMEKCATVDSCITWC